MIDTINHLVFSRRYEKASEATCRHLKGASRKEVCDAIPTF